MSGLGEAAGSPSSAAGGGEGRLKLPHWLPSRQRRPWSGAMPEKNHGSRCCQSPRRWTQEIVKKSLGNGETSAGGLSNTCHP